MKTKSQNIVPLSGKLPFQKRIFSLFLGIVLFATSSNQILSRIPFAKPFGSQIYTRNKQDSSFIQAYIREKNPKIEDSELELLTNTILQESEKLEFSLSSRSIHLNKVDFLLAIIQTESEFRSLARSHKNAQGYMQLMPSTAKWMSEKSGSTWVPSDITDTTTNLTLGVEYLNYLIDEMGTLERATLAYNAGPKAVRRWGGVPSYWTKIMDNYKTIQSRKRDKSNAVSMY